MRTMLLSVGTNIILLRGVYNMNITAVRLRRTRRLKSMSQQELADKVGVSKATICRYERGKVENIKKGVLAKIAAELGVSYQYLLDIDLPAYYVEDDENAKIERIIGNKIHEYLDNYEKMDEQGRRMIRENIDVLLKYA